MLMPWSDFFFCGVKAFLLILFATIIYETAAAIKERKKDK